MGEAFITRRGGGIPYAVIGVTYPSGSTCTCTNGTLTLTAKDTSGKAVFPIPYAGTWTVKAVKGSQSVSKSVSITADGQVATVTLSYYLALYENGDKTSVTGGWSYGGNTITVDLAATLNNETCIYIHGGNDDKTLAVVTKNKIDLSSRSTLKAKILQVKSAQYAYLAIADTTNAGEIIYGAWGAHSEIPLSASNTVVSLDISSVTGSKAICLILRTNSSDSRLYANNIQLV